MFSFLRLPRELDQLESCEACKLLLIKFHIIYMKKYLQVKDGVNKSLGSFCGYKNPPPLLALSGVLIIKFHSDRHVNYKGFLAIFNDSQGNIFL